MWRGCRGHDKSITEKEGESRRKLEQVEVEVLIIFLSDSRATRE